MFPDIGVHYEDITTRDNNTTPRVDLYVAGPVCQPLSRAGMGMGLSDSRARTWLACLGYIRKARPKAIVMENVPKLATNPVFKSTMYDSIVEILTELGYEVTSYVLNTADFNVPQTRERLYIVEITGNAKRCKFAWPEMALA